MGLGALLSALLANDIVCLAFAPVIVVSVRRAGRDPAPHLLGLALASTFAGNLLLIGSIANLIVVEQARAWGITIGLRRHAAVGVPVTLVSLAVLWGWIALVG